MINRTIYSVYTRDVPCSVPFDCARALVERYPSALYSVEYLVVYTTFTIYHQYKVVYTIYLILTVLTIYYQLLYTTSRQ